MVNTIFIRIRKLLSTGLVHTSLCHIGNTVDVYLYAIITENVEKVVGLKNGK